MSFGVVGEDCWGTIAEQAVALGVEPETLLAIVVLQPGTIQGCTQDHLILRSQAKRLLETALHEVRAVLEKP